MKRLLLFGLLTLLFSTPALAQPITITEADVQEGLDEGDFAYQGGFAAFVDPTDFSPLPPEDSVALQNKMQAILNQIGEGGTYDFSSIDFAFFSSAVLEVRSLPVGSDVPGASVFNDSDAEYASASLGVSGSSRIYSYVGVQSDGLYEYGTAQEGEEPEVNEPPERQLVLPLEMGTSWSRVETEETAGITTTDSTHSEVVGYGQLVTPSGTAPALVLRQQTITTTSGSFGGTDTTETTTFYAKDLRLSAVISINEEGVPGGAFYFAESSETADPADVASGFVGDVLNALGLDIDFTGASTTDGTLRAFRVGFVPTGSTFSGSATSGSGDEVTPDSIVSDGYYVVEASDLSGFEYSVCLSYADLSVDDPGALIPLKREDASEPWTPLDATLDEDAERVCADGLTSFSQFALGANSSDIGTPVEEEPQLSEAVALRGAAPNPTRGATTIRYELPSAAHVTLHVYDALGRAVTTLVDGRQHAGAQQVRFDAAGLPSGLYVYRLAAGGVSKSGTLVVVK